MLRLPPSLSAIFRELTMFHTRFVLILQSTTSSTCRGIGPVSSNRSGLSRNRYSLQSVKVMVSSPLYFVLFSRWIIFTNWISTYVKFYDINCFFRGYFCVSRWGRRFSKIGGLLWGKIWWGTFYHMVGIHWNFHSANSPEPTWLMVKDYPRNVADKSSRNQMNTMKQWRMSLFQCDKANRPNINWKNLK